MGKVKDWVGSLIDTLNIKKPEGELPGIEKGKIGRDYVSEGLTPSKLATLLKEADEGKIASQINLFEQMEEKDTHLQAEYGKRCNAIFEPDFDIEPADESSEAKKMSDFATDVFSDLNMLDLYVALQDAVGKGFSACEINWDYIDNKLIPINFDFITQRRFIFDGKIPLLITDNNEEGETIPPYKMIMHQYGGLSGDPKHPKIFRACAWMYLFKNYSLKDWVIFAEVFGMPLRLGKYPAGANDDQKKALKRALLSLGADGAGIIPQGSEIELIFSSAKSGADIYEKLATFAEKGMSKALLGQTLTADVGKTGSYAASQTHNEIRKDIMFADARAMSSTIRFQLIRPLIGFNFGWDKPIPKFIPRITEPEDLETTSRTYKTLVEMGLKIPLDHVYSKFNIPEPTKDTDVLSLVENNTNKEEKPLKLVLKDNFKLSSEQQVIEDVIDKNLEKLKGSKSENIKDILNLIEQSESYEELSIKLLEFYPQKENKEFVDLLSNSLFSADLWGRKNG